MVSVCRATRATKAAGSYFLIILHKGQDRGGGGPTTWLGGGTGGEGCTKVWSDSARQITPLLFISSLPFSLFCLLLMIFPFLFLILLLQQHLDAIHYFCLFVCHLDQLFVQGMCKCVTPGLHLQHWDFENLMVIMSFGLQLSSALSSNRRTGHTMLSVHLGEKWFTSPTTNLKNLHFSSAVCQTKIYHFWLETASFLDIAKSEAFIWDGETPGS